MTKSHRTPHAHTADWRYGPLLNSGGEICVGDPLKNHLVLEPTGMRYRTAERAGHTEQLTPWSHIAQITLVCDTAPSRIPAHLVALAHYAVAALSGTAETIEAYEPGILRCTTFNGESFEWEIHSLETGKYWERHVHMTQRLLNALRTDPALQNDLQSAAVLQQWCERQLAR